MRWLVAGIVAWCGLCGVVAASELRDLSPVTDKILLLHFVDGKAIHGTPGHGEEERIEVVPLDLAKAASPAAYEITSADDPGYAKAANPLKVGRKTKGRDFVNNHGKIEYVREHWIYLVLPQPMQTGKTYAVAVGDLTSSADKQAKLVFDTAKARSETLHVNQVGYVPSAPMKFAYVSAWMGDLGPLSLDEYADVQFHLIDVKTGKSAFDGKPALRKRLTEADTGQAEAPHSSYIGADVWECDFSSFSTAGEYVVAVDRIGCSFPFKIAPDVYREAFLTTVRGLYHQRCGVELKEPYTQWTRAACHRGSDRHPIKVTRDTYMEHSHSDGDAKADAKTTGEVRNDCWGGWHDAGDWDREGWHPYVSATLLLAYECAPRHFADGEQNIPESGNGIPDIIDEAIWGVDYYKRIQRPNGAVSNGIYEEGCPRLGMTSWTDPMKWYMYSDDPQATYKYAAIASQLSWCLKLAGKAELAGPYVDSAVKAWDWAQANSTPAMEKSLRDVRLHAAAALYKATGQVKYQEAFKRDLVIDTPETSLSIWEKHDQQWGVWVYTMTDQPGIDQALKQRLTQAALNCARNEYVQTAARRGTRVAYNWWIPLAWGASTEPRVLPLIVAHHLSQDAAYLGPICTACDNTLGGNPMNTAWVTGLGHRSPLEIMHWDSWYGVMGGQPAPGIIPMGPRAFTTDAAGPWLPGYAMKTFYPDAKTWPPYELWTDNRLCPPTNEFTVGNIATTAAAFGYLCADRK